MRKLRGILPTSKTRPKLGPTRDAVATETLLQVTIKLVNLRVGAYMREYGKDEMWATAIRAYYTHLLTGEHMPGTIRIDTEVKQLVRQWVDEARQQTGLAPPNRATKRKKKR